MVKRQKEKQYQSASEHRANSSIRAGTAGASSGGVRQLPFNCCALSLMPYTTPVCANNGIVFEKTAIEPFLADHKRDPVTGTLMAMKDLITLNMNKDEQGRWQCPVLTKPFADHTKIVAIKQSPTEANVYSYDAYQELNVKPKNYEDLISGKKFNKKTDVIVLNDPNDKEFQRLRDINTFFHVKNERQLEQKTTNTDNIRYSVTATRILDKLKKSKDDSDSKKRSSKDDLKQEGKRLKIFSDDVTGVKYTAGKTSASLTSTAMSVAHDSETREATDEEVLQSLFAALRKKKQKGYVKLKTNLGDILLELHCDIVPRTCMNFLKLCEANKYDGSPFHRLIKNFMAQVGKPPTDQTDELDESHWGGAFADEFDNRLKHDGAGVLSMANAGPNTNRRQFFITLKSCEHLNRKHSVFGTVVGGLEVLQLFETIPTDKKDRPLEEVKILTTEIVVNPVKEAEEAEIKRIEARAEGRRKEADKAKLGSAAVEKRMAKDDFKSNAKQSPNSQIGRYLPKAAVTKGITNAGSGEDEIGVPKGSILGPTNSMSLVLPHKKASKKGKMQDFNGW